MSQSVRRSVLGTSAAAVLSASLLAAPVSAAAPAARIKANDPAVAYVVERYGVSTADAIRRLTLQDSAPEVDAAARRALGAAFVGTWIDQEHGGDIVVDTTDAARAGALRGRTGVRVRTVRYGNADLDAIERELDAVANEDVQVFVRVAKDNAIQVRLAKGKPLPAAVRRVMARYPGAVVVARGLLRYGLASGCYFTVSTIPYCDTPLRGGVGIRYWDYPNPAVTCTAGFIVRSKTTHLPYVMTAGHCSKLDPYGNLVSMRTGGMWETKTPGTGSGFYDIGDNHNAIYSANTDAGIFRIDLPSVWNPENWVYSNNGAELPEYPITAISGSTANIVVCHTGATIVGTRCGTVVSVGYDDPTSVPQDLALVEGCAKRGDSGGPVFKANKAYGIVSGGYWDWDDNPDVDCSNYWAYVGITYAANALNVYVATS